MNELPALHNNALRVMLALTTDPLSWQKMASDTPVN
jgi:hypothetical protein